MQKANDFFADVILPLPFENLFTYRIPEDFPQLLPGMRVIVPLGNKKFYTALVFKTHSAAPTLYKVKDLIDPLDPAPIVTEQQLKFWQWLSTYYQCTLGEVFKAALPSGLKLESETKISLKDDFVAETPLKGNEEIIFQILFQEDTLTINQLNFQSGLKNVYPVIKRLFDKGAVKINETLKKGYKPKKETYITFFKEPENEESLKTLFDSISRAPKQQELFMTFLDISGFIAKGKASAVSRKELLQKNTSFNHGLIKTLCDKEILKTFEKEIHRINSNTMTLSSPKTLNTFQDKALEEIETSWHSKNVTLLHGVTASGKTEIYIHLIKKTIDQGKQVLYLLPEIALTTQITTRLQKIFGDQLAVYHSKYSDAERVETWQQIFQNKRFNIVLGARSAIFLPFQRLGLVIVDEEHENTYKQFDPAPRYHARDAAIVLAQMSGAKVLLGTATPSLESYNNAISGKFGLVELTKRHREIALPEILTVNIQEARRRKQMKSHFSPLLIQKMTEALENNEQVLLFQNRRGFSPFLECKSCSWIPKCQNCDVSLTYHKGANRLSCHYCGFTMPIPTTCPVCGTPGMETRGFGTEKIEDEIKIFFPKARVKRMDLDTARTRRAHETIINDFENHQIDILVGTQMISKGLDFENVSVVGILNADNMLNFPDFRAHERSYQLIAQVSGRAGRKKKQGCVILQTTNPEHPIIRDVIHNNYKHMYQLQVEERQFFKYPPFYRLIGITLKHRKKPLVDEAASLLGNQLRGTFGDRVLGPEDPPVGRIQSWYLKKILIKIERDAPLSKVKSLLKKSILELQGHPSYRSLMAFLDVDPH